MPRLIEVMSMLPAFLPYPALVTNLSLPWLYRTLPAVPLGLELKMIGLGTRVPSYCP